MDESERRDFLDSIEDAVDELDTQYYEPQIHISPDMSDALRDEMNTTRRPRWDKVRETKFWDGYLP